MPYNLSISNTFILYDIRCSRHSNAFTYDSFKVKFYYLVIRIHSNFLIVSNDSMCTIYVCFYYYYRSVNEEERSFALGMQFVIFRLFGYIPAPILFGNLIDSTCLFWKSTCGEKGGRCLLYDIEQFRYRLVDNVIIFLKGQFVTSLINV